jgi:hypothetical protein
MHHYQKAEEIFNDLKLGLLHSVIVVCFERKQSVHCYSDPEDLKLREDLLLAYENVSHTRTKNRKHVCINNNANVNEIDENFKILISGAPGSYMVTALKYY